MKYVVALIAVEFLAGCPYHRQKNAPGIIDVKVPPADMSLEQVEEPRDPGEHVVMLSLGGFGGAGLYVGDGSSNFAAEAGVEASVHWGESETSHEKGQPILPMPPVVLPRTRRGINLGWVAYEPTEDDSEESELGPLYLEYQESERVWGWAVGYAYDPEDQSHGPQASVNGFGYYAKASYRVDRGFHAVLGVVIKIPQSIVWSR